MISRLRGSSRKNLAVERKFVGGLAMSAIRIKGAYAPGMQSKIRMHMSGNVSGRKAALRSRTLEVKPDPKSVVSGFISDAPDEFFTEIERMLAAAE